VSVFVQGWQTVPKGVCGVNRWCGGPSRALLTVMGLVLEQTQRGQPINARVALHYISCQSLEKQKKSQQPTFECDENTRISLGNTGLALAWRSPKEKGGEWMKSSGILSHSCEGSRAAC
jgi:hypothetical protein